MRLLPCGIFWESNKIEHKKRNDYYCNGIKRAGKGKIQYEIEWQKDCGGHGSNESDLRSGMHQNRALSEIFPVDSERGVCIRGRSGTDSGCGRPAREGYSAAGNHWEHGECD